MKTRQLLLASLLIVAGCTSSVSQSDGTTVNWVRGKGELQGSLAGSLPKAEEATRKAFDELRFVGVDGAVDGLRGQLTARMADGTRVRVNLRAIDFENTRIVIKIGTFGNRAISLQLYRHIERQLATAAAPE